MNEITTLQQARRFIYEEMVRLREGKVSVDEAIAQGKLASHLIETYRVEVKAIELTIEANKTQIEYQEAAKLIG